MRDTFGCTGNVTIMLGEHGKSPVPKPGTRPVQASLPRFHVRIHVRIRCESNANECQFQAVWEVTAKVSFIGGDRLRWWSRGESNPRPQAIVGQIYMLSWLIWF
jgi:hypothetical protein